MDDSRKFTLSICLLINLASFALSIASSAPISQFIELEHTDGDNLAIKLAPISAPKRQHLFEEGIKSCQTGCITPFGQLLGEADGIKSYSNCQSNCIKSEYSFLNLQTQKIVIADTNPDKSQYHYIGVIHQCVEYARKWWMIQKGITFGSIDSAFEIIYLTEGKHINTNMSFPLGRSINGSASRPPKRGDLLIYSADRKRSNWQYGHVAVVIETDLESNALYIAEENYSNRAWENPKRYSRKIHISSTKSGYRVTDQDRHRKDPNQRGVVSGWIYPLNDL